MRNRYLIALTIVGLLSINVNAQNRQGQRPFAGSRQLEKQDCQLNKLSDTQKEQMQAERIRFQKSIQAEQNQLNELRAKKQTLQTSEPANKEALESVLKQMNALHTSIQKKKVRHHQAIKSFLNEEQILMFDSKRGPRHQAAGPKRKGMACQAGCQGPGHKGGKAFQNKGMRKGPEKQGRHQHQQPGRLSADSQEQVKTMRLALLKKEQPLRNQLNELNARLKTLTTGQSVDLKKVDKIIEQQAAIKLEIAELRSEHHLAVRAQLNEGEKIWFDQRHSMAHGPKKLCGQVSRR